MDNNATIENKENTAYRLRDIHIEVENIYEEIKKDKSSFIYKAIFYILFFVSAILFIIHSVKFGFGFGMIFIFFLIGYFFYFTFKIKTSLKENIKTLKPQKIDPENSQFLQSRIQYISEGIQVTFKRASLVRNFYIIFFPIMAFIFIDILKGPLPIKAYFVTLIVSILLGGVFWYFYFRNDLTEIENDINELAELKTKISNH